MPKFTVYEVQDVTERCVFRYDVEADSQAEAIEAVRAGDHKGDAEECGPIGDPDYHSSGFGATINEAVEDLADSF